jgi:hypothetical protein
MPAERPGQLADLELHGALGLVLHHSGARRNLVSMTDVSDLEGDEIAPAKLAVDTQVEEREISHPPFHHQADAQPRCLSL